MQSNIKHIILANMNIKLYSWPWYVLQGSAATDLTGAGSFNSTFLPPQILFEFNSARIMNIGPLLPKLS